MICKISAIENEAMCCDGSARSLQLTTKIIENIPGSTKKNKHMFMLFFIFIKHTSVVIDQRNFRDVKT